MVEQLGALLTGGLRVGPVQVVLQLVLLVVAAGCCIMVSYSCIHRKTSCRHTSVVVELSDGKQLSSSEPSATVLASNKHGPSPKVQVQDYSSHGNRRRLLAFPSLPELAANVNRFELNHPAVAILTTAVRERTPVVLRANGSSTCVTEIKHSWEHFVHHQQQDKYQTNTGQTDGTLAGGERKTLYEVWKGPYRVETQLREGDADRPVRDWLERQDEEGQVQTLAAFVHDVEVLAGMLLRGAEILTPSFILGNTRQRGGGPTHEDAYHNFAVVLVGVKTFYILPPDALAHIGNPKSDDYHVRGDVEPFDQLRQLPWIKVDLRLGDLFYLPPCWWHHVISDPCCVMTNTWAWTGD